MHLARILRNPGAHLDHRAGAAALHISRIEMAYLAPSEFVTKMVDAGESKVFMATRDTVIRAYMAGAILALAAVFAVSVQCFPTNFAQSTANGGL